MLKKNQIVEGKITKLEEDLSGIMMLGKDKVFVRHVLLNEVVSVKIIKKIQKGYVGELVAYKKPSKQRAKVSCGIYEKCGSCQLLHMTYEAQTSYKEQILSNLCKQHKSLQLKSVGVLGMQEPFHYRNKMIIGFQKGKNCKIRAGFYEEFSHRIVPYQTCLLHPSVCDEIVQTIVRLMEKFKIEPYEEDYRRGLLRHVLLRYGEETKQIMVVFVLNQKVFPARKQFVDALCKAHPEITTIVQNVNTRKTSVVLGDEERVLYGKGYIEDVLCGYRFRISSKSFYQINHTQTQRLYQTAIDMLELTGKETLLDAYCGIGTIGMCASQHVKEVIGVEVNKQAIQDAKQNAKLNHISNIRFVCADASTWMRQMAKEGLKLDVVIMDPPRSGSDEHFIKSAVSMKPKKILYISCNPMTQMRDLDLFQRYGYQGNVVQGVDLFPHTFHVESVVLLTKIHHK